MVLLTAPRHRGRGRSQAPEQRCRQEV